jgi:hypothetical protein
VVVVVDCYQVDSAEYFQAPIYFGVSDRRHLSVQWFLDYHGPNSYPRDSGFYLYLGRDLDSGSCGSACLCRGSVVRDFAGRFPCRHDYDLDCDYDGADDRDSATDPRAGLGSGYDSGSWSDSDSWCAVPAIVVHQLARRASLELDSSLEVLLVLAPD